MAIETNVWDTPEREAARRLIWEGPVKRYLTSLEECQFIGDLDGFEKLPDPPTFSQN